VDPFSELAREYQAASSSQPRAQTRISQFIPELPPAYEADDKPLDSTTVNIISEYREKMESLASPGTDFTPDATMTASPKAIDPFPGSDAEALDIRIRQRIPLTEGLESSTALPAISIEREDVHAHIFAIWRTTYRTRNFQFTHHRPVTGSPYLRRELK